MCRGFLQMTLAVVLRLAVMVEQAENQVQEVLVVQLPAVMATKNTLAVTVLMAWQRQPRLVQGEVERVQLATETLLLEQPEG
jgi:hypothetical protein